MQLMPHLVTCLHKRDTAKQPAQACNGGIESQELISWTEHARLGMFIDFGCLYIFTCSQSCWNDNDIICHEVVAMQPDPETSILS